MRVENLSIRTATIFIFVMIAAVAIVLSVLAGNYFRRSALDAQMSNLTRVIEVASQEVFRHIRGHAFDLGMKLANGTELIEAVRKAGHADGRNTLVRSLDDPFINGFVNVAEVDMVKLRVYTPDLRLIAESSLEKMDLGDGLPAYLDQTLRLRSGIERLKAVDALWNGPRGPLHSTVVPIGGLRLTGYLEVVVDPAFNFPDIARITKTPVSVFAASGKPLSESVHEDSPAFLPVVFNLKTSDGHPAFRIVGYENVEKLNAEMEHTKTVTISSFLLLSMLTLAFALWLFNRFLFIPVSRMIADMGQIAQGNMDAVVNKTGLREFYILADSFNSMAHQVKVRTEDLRDSHNRLRHLLDLDDNAILYFAADNGVAYFNKRAADLFGYEGGEIDDLEFADLFAEDAPALLGRLTAEDGQHSLRIKVRCRSKSGAIFECNALFSLLKIMGESGYAVVASPVAVSSDVPARQHNANLEDKNALQVEQSLKRIMKIAGDNPALLLGIDVLDLSEAQLGSVADKKAVLRERAVAVMSSALACWEHDLGKSKVNLADESGIWPVYLDKSTPTTRTLDKYLHIDSCPKNPRCQRVVDTAEFVLRQTGEIQTPNKQKVIESTDALRQAMSGV